MNIKNLKVALVHDYLREYGGAERVLEDLYEIFPNTPVYTAYYNPKALGQNAKRFDDWDIRTSFIQKIPFANFLLSALRVLAPFAFESFELSSYDLVISSCNLYSAKGVLTGTKTLHISYIHTPPKMLYGYTTSFNYKKWFVTRTLGELANHFLRIYDFEISQRPDILVANSENVANRIKKFYRRDAKVVYPAIDVERYKKVKKAKGDYYLSVGRLVRGKGVEIVIAVCSKLNLPLKVAGSGPELERLKRIAGKSVQFLGYVSDEEKVKLYAGAKALIVATEEEDFGLTPIEAMAAGTPVIAAKAGGYLETVIPGKTGELFNISPNLGESKSYVDEESVKNLISVLEHFDSSRYREEELRKFAERFSKARFKKEILDLIEKNLRD